MSVSAALERRGCRLWSDPPETKVLASLFGGRALTATAATLGITRPTAKTHLAHIFLKTGVTRQAELMRLWTGLISPSSVAIAGIVRSGQCSGD